MNFVLATRGSALALWQAEETRRLLLHAHPTWSVELAIVQSSGDRDTRTELADFARTAIFTAEVDAFVQQGRAHAGVHSLKDMTTRLPQGLMLAGVLARAPAHDVLVTRDGARLADLPAGARVATGSVRRVAFLRHARPDLVPIGIRGNVDTRLAKLDAGEADALILAHAGLLRLGLAARISEVFALSTFVPAVGQGIVGITCRRGDLETSKALGAIADVEAFSEAIAERALLHALHGGCNAPIGAHARCVEGGLALHAAVMAIDGSVRLEERGNALAEDAAALGEEVAERLRARGAAQWIDAARAR